MSYNDDVTECSICGGDLEEDEIDNLDLFDGPAICNDCGEE